MKTVPILNMLSPSMFRTKEEFEKCINECMKVGSFINQVSRETKKALFSILLAFGFFSLNSEDQEELSASDKKVISETSEKYTIMYRRILKNIYGCRIGTGKTFSLFYYIFLMKNLNIPSAP